jgi:hypothetical protein
MSDGARVGDYAQRQMSTAELQQLPNKADGWTDDEVLGLYVTSPDRFETCCGAATPEYVQTPADRVRWAHCCRAATVTMGESAAGALAGMTARAMFNDRDTYTTP